MTESNYYDDALELLKKLISTQSFSREEGETAETLEQFLGERGVAFQRKGHNVFAFSKHYKSELPSILLNSHHDTVKPNQGYTKDPFAPIIENKRLYGLGSNDAGGCLVSLMVTFVHFYESELPFNLVLACTSEEEISGRGGVESILEDLGSLDYGIIGEPTEMKMAIAEKGLVVVDGVANGVSGHAARDLGENAIYKAIEDIQKLKNYTFPNESAYLGPIKVSITQIEGGYQHNVIPDTCKFVIDIRTTDAYDNEEVVRLLQQEVTSELKPRSVRLRPSFMPTDTPIYEVAKKLEIEVFGSATTSDQAVIPIPTIKMGPGKSERSHTADEYLELEELRSGVEGYIRFINELTEIYKRKQS